MELRRKVVIGVKDMAFMHSMCKQANSDSGTVYIQQPFSLEIMPWEGLTLECETIEELSFSCNNFFWPLNH